MRHMLSLSIYQNEREILYASDMPLILVVCSLSCLFSPPASLPLTPGKALLVALRLGQVRLAQTLHLEMLPNHARKARNDP